MNARMTRRDALRLAAGGTLAAIPALKLAGPALAGRTWCRQDPLFSIGGHLFDVSFGSYTDMYTAATGPVQITLVVPVGVPVAPIYQDDGFGFGYDVTVVESRKLKLGNNSLGLRVAVTCPATDDTLPVEVYLSALATGDGVTQFTATGLANQPVLWSGKIDTVTPVELAARLLK